VKKLPLNKNESIYFQWGTHKIPFFLAAHSLGITYITVEGFPREVLDNIYKMPNWESYSTHNRERVKRTIRYLVVMDDSSVVDKNGRIITWDTPHPRMILEQGDKVILRWQNLIVLEKLIPIDFNNK
jgi:hypothetical protein